MHNKDANRGLPLLKVIHFPFLLKKRSARKSSDFKIGASFCLCELLLQCYFVCFLLYEKQFKKQISIYYIL